MNFSYYKDASPNEPWIKVVSPTGEISFRPPHNKAEVDDYIRKLVEWRISTNSEDTTREDDYNVYTQRPRPSTERSNNFYTLTNKKPYSPKRPTPPVPPTSKPTTSTIFNNGTQDPGTGVEDNEKLANSKLILGLSLNSWVAIGLVVILISIAFWILCCMCRRRKRRADLMSQAIDPESTYRTQQTDSTLLNQTNVSNLPNLSSDPSRRSTSTLRGSSVSNKGFVSSTTTPTPSPRQSSRNPSTKAKSNSGSKLLNLTPSSLKGPGQVVKSSTSTASSSHRRRKREKT